MAKMIQGAALYYSLFSAPCRTVLMTLKALCIEMSPGGMRKMDIHGRHEHLEPWFVKLNRERVVPTLVDNGFILWESRAIAKYLVQKYASTDKRYLYPSDITHQASVDRILYFDQGILYQTISDYFRPQAVDKEKPNPILGADVERSLEILDRTLEYNKYILGSLGGPNNLTIADFSLLASLSQLESMDFSYERHNYVDNYVNFLRQELPYYSDCFDEGVALAKDWARTQFKYLPKYAAEGKV